MLQEYENKMINVGFIGLGNMARMQISSFELIRGCRLYAGADPSEGARQIIAERFPGMKLFADHQTLLSEMENSDFFYFNS